MSFSVKYLKRSIWQQCYGSKGVCLFSFLDRASMPSMGIIIICTPANRPASPNPPQNSYQTPWFHQSCRGEKGISLWVNLHFSSCEWRWTSSHVVKGVWDFLTFFVHVPLHLFYELSTWFFGSLYPLRKIDLLVIWAANVFLDRYLHFDLWKNVLGCRN